MGGRGSGGGGAATREAAAENRILGAYEALRPETAGHWVGLADLREHLKGLNRTEVDDALRKLARAPGVRLAPADMGSTYPWTGRKEPLGSRDREAAIRIGASDRHMISIRKPR